MFTASFEPQIYLECLNGLSDINNWEINFLIIGFPQLIMEKKTFAITQYHVNLDIKG